MKDYSGITNLFSARGDFALTTRGTLLGGLKLSGVDVAVFSEDELIRLTQVWRNILITAPVNVVLTSIFVAADDQIIKYDLPDNGIAKKVVKARERFLNDANLSMADCYLFFEMEPPAGYFSRIGFWSLLFDLLNVFTSKEARKRLNFAFNNIGSLMFHDDTLGQMESSLRDALRSANKRFSIIMTSHILSISEIWKVSKFLVTYNSKHLSSNEMSVPPDNWQNHVQEGDATVITYRDTEMLEIKGVNKRYVRFGSVTKWIDETIPVAGFFYGANAPVPRINNCVYMCRFRPLSVLAHTSYFRKRSDELKRMNINILDMLTGRKEVEHNKEAKGSFKEMAKELDEASHLPERWGHFSIAIAVYGDADDIVRNSPTVQSNFESSGASIVWESRGVPFSYRQLTPTAPDADIRSKPFNITQFAACAAFYSENNGEPFAKDIGKEHLFTFVTRTGEPFYYSPLAEGAVGTIGVGPIGTGKSFTKNALATHWGKYSGFYRAIDYDAGTEPVANLYQDDGSIFSLDLDNNFGLNPFAVANESNNSQVAAHIKDLVQAMLSHNKSVGAQRLTEEEEFNLSNAINQTLRLKNNDARSFPGLVSMLSQSLQSKLSEYVEDGTYSRLFGVTHDSVGMSELMYGIYNLASLKENPVLSDLAMREIFWRNTMLFEDRKYRHIPKMLDIDEAHLILSKEREAEKIVKYIRTGRKQMLAVSLWSQSPNEFMQIPDWNALRSAAATFFFMNDPSIDEDAYRKGFGLTQGEIDIIPQLEPRKEMLIVQRRLGVSKIVQLTVDAPQYALCTSTPLEATKRDALIEELGFDRGIEEFSKTIQLN